ncbi:MAG: hypothetical protein ACXVB6_21430, partial [Mucilaginibacter sp.]
HLILIKGFLSIILPLLLLSFLIGHAAKKRGKNPWLWGVISFLLITALSWKQIPTWAAFVYYKGMVAMQSMKPKESITTLAEAKKINIHSSVDGVHFDVPLTYHFRGYDQKNHGWPGVPEGQISGTERPAVDFIHIYALLPDLVPMNEENLAEFEVLGNGKKVMASLTHYRPWGYDFSRLQLKPDNPKIQKMLYYYRQTSKEYLYLSHNYATPDLTAIECHDPSFWHDVSPSCKVITFYDIPPKLIESMHTDGVKFRLEYHFSSQYLEHWREIDQKLKSLFDQFIRNAAQQSLTN